MSKAALTKQWDDETTLTEAQLDAFLSSIETFSNTGVIDSENIQTGGLATANFSDASITAAKIATGAITGGKLGDSDSFSLPASKFATGSVTKAKRPDQAVTTDGSDPGEEGVVKATETTSSTSFASGTTSAISGTDITLTTSGRPVLIRFEGTAAYIGSPDSSSKVELYRSGAATGYQWAADSVSTAPAYVGDGGNFEDALALIDTGINGTASTYTWDIRLTSINTNGGLDLTDFRMVAYEL